MKAVLFFYTSGWQDFVIMQHLQLLMVSTFSNEYIYVPDCIATIKPGCVAHFRVLLSLRHRAFGITKSCSL